MSTEMLPQLPPEIIIEILARLPVKPLFRLKSVCKSWLSLISNNPHFAKLHLHYAKLDTTVNRYSLFLTSSPFRSIDHIGLCNGENVMIRELSCSNIAGERTFFKFLGSSNGLIAASYFKPDFHSNNMNPDIIVWNSTTGVFRELPASDSSISGNNEIFSGFCYDKKLDDYKIVRGVVITRGSDMIKLEVFNFKANKWRWSQDVYSNLFLDRRYFIYTEGFMHCLVDFQKGSEEKFGILSFDLGAEKFVEIVEVPDHLTQLVGFMIMGVGDDVCVSTNSVWSREYLEGWLMKRHGSEISWRKLYRYELDLPTSSPTRIDIVWVAKNGNAVLHVDSKELLVYNRDAEQISSVYGSEEFNIIDYMETLVSPNVSQFSV